MTTPAPVRFKIERFRFNPSTDKDKHGHYSFWVRFVVPGMVNLSSSGWKLCRKNDKLVLGTPSENKGGRYYPTAEVDKRTYDAIQAAAMVEFNEATGSEEVSE